MSTEIKDMMSSLVAIIQRASQTQIKPPAPTTQVLHTPLKLLVKAEYVGTNYRHLVAQPGDDLIVYAWTNNKQTAIVYNARYGIAGRIPANVLQMEASQPVMGSEICVSFSDNKGNGAVGSLTWKAGDYLRICKWDNGYRNSGIGFNLATVEIGLFSVGVGNLKNIRPSDQLK